MIVVRFWCGMRKPSTTSLDVDRDRRHQTRSANQGCFAAEERIAADERRERRRAIGISRAGRAVDARRGDPVRRRFGVEDDRADVLEHLVRGVQEGDRLATSGGR